jgi:hypothetical protein
MEMTERTNRLMATYMAIKPIAENIFKKSFNEITIEEIKEKLTDVMGGIKSVVDRTQWNYAVYNRAKFMRNEVVATFFVLSTWLWHFMGFLKDICSLNRETYFPYEAKGEYNTLRTMMLRVIPTITALAIYQILSSGLFGISQPFEDIAKAILKIFGKDKEIDMWKALKIINTNNLASSILWFGLPYHFGLSPYAFGPPGLLGTAMLEWSRDFLGGLSAVMRGRLNFLDYLKRVILPIPFIRLWEDWEPAYDIELRPYTKQIPYKLRPLLSEIQTVYKAIKITRWDRILRRIGAPTRKSYELWVLSNAFREFYHHYDYVYKMYNRKYADLCFEGKWDEALKLLIKMQKEGIPQSLEIQTNQIQRRILAKTRRK